MADTEKITIMLKYKYLKHDIDQWTYRLANMRVEDSELKSDAQSSTTSTDVSYYRRKIVEAVAELRSILKDRVIGTSSDTDDTLDTTETAWIFYLKKGNYINDTRSLTDLMHKFVVRNVIATWAGTYAPDAVATVTADLQSVEKDLVKEALNRKMPALDDYTATGTTELIL